jgi:hypothetical protein
MLTAAGLFFPPLLLLGPLLVCIGLGKMGADEARGGGQQQAVPDAQTLGRMERMEESAREQTALVKELTNKLEQLQQDNALLRKQADLGPQPNEQAVANIMTVLAPLPAAITAMGSGQESTAVQDILTQVLAQLTQLNTPTQAARGSGNTQAQSRGQSPTGTAPTGTALAKQTEQIAANAQGTNREQGTIVSAAYSASALQTRTRS